MTSAVCACGEPIRDSAFLCSRCTGRLSRDLGEVQNLLDEAETTRLRQSRTGGRGVGVTSRNSERPLPFNEGPGKAMDALFRVMRVWAQVVVEGRQVGWPRDRTADLARFLLLHLDWLRRQESAPDLFEQLVRAIGRLRGSVDRPADLTYAGICSEWVIVGEGDDVELTQCAQHLYVPFGRRQVLCPACGTVHDMAQRREVLLAALEDQLAHVALLSQGLSNLGRELKESTVRSWVFRKRLVPHGQDDLGRELYRVGDVLDLMRAEAVRQAELAAKREQAEAKARRRAAC